MTLDVIPVLDLMRGQVVRAQRGERSRYQPMRSPLVDGHAPVDVARALLAHTGSTVLYVADLDALMGGRLQHGVLRELIAALQGTRLWLDGGWPDLAAGRADLANLGDPAAQAVDPVLGSESLRDEHALRAWQTEADAGEPLARRAILSLDRRDQQRQGDDLAWQQPAQWPLRVIAMTLERVGAASGPDLDTLRALQADLRRHDPARAAATHWIGAGGIRHAADLQACAQAGAQAWLVASALHDGGVPPQRPASASAGLAAGEAASRGPNLHGPA